MTGPVAASGAKFGEIVRRADLAEILLHAALVQRRVAVLAVLEPLRPTLVRPVQRLKSVCLAPVFDGVGVVTAELKVLAELAVRCGR